MSKPYTKEGRDKLTTAWDAEQAEAAETRDYDTLESAVRAHDWGRAGDIIGHYTQWPIDDIQDWLSHGDWSVIRPPRAIAAEWDARCAQADRLAAYEQEQDYELGDDPDVE